MYLDYWGMTARPFSERPASNAVYQSEARRTAALRLSYARANQCSLALLVGESGTGKTSVLSGLAADGADDAAGVVVPFCGLRVEEFLRLAAVRLGAVSSVQEISEEGRDQICERMEAAAVRLCSASEESLLLAFDDAHLIPSETMREAVYSIVNLAERMPYPGMTVVLSGRPSLLGEIRRLPQLSERVAVTATMDGLTRAESRDYLCGRILAVGGRPGLFSESALESVYELSLGNIRRINRVADMALLVGFAQQQDEITDTIVRSLECELLQSEAA